MEPAIRLSNGELILEKEPPGHYIMATPGPVMENKVIHHAQLER